MSYGGLKHRSGTRKLVPVALIPELRPHTNTCPEVGGSYPGAMRTKNRERIEGTEQDHIMRYRRDRGTGEEPPMGWAVLSREFGRGLLWEQPPYPVSILAVAPALVERNIRSSQPDGHWT